MPVYEYLCHTCNAKHEKLRPMREADAPVTCPVCHEQNSVRALSLCAVHSGGSDGAATGYEAAPTMTTGGGCAGCHGGSCATCH
jgi:putative FmdB family regulatory protein